MDDSRALAALSVLANGRSYGLFDAIWRVGRGLPLADLAMSPGLSPHHLADDIRRLAAADLIYEERSLLYANRVTLAELFRFLMEDRSDGAPQLGSKMGDAIEALINA